MRGSFQAADLPGRQPDLVAQLGRAGRHTGAQPRTTSASRWTALEAFCRELEAKGVTFDRPYQEIEALGLGIAFFTDPWGTYIELTEGLDEY